MIIKVEDLPTEFMSSRKKKFTFNLNQYRNANYHTLNKAKRYFHTYIKLLNIQESFKGPVKIRYEIWCRKNADMMNIGAVVDKFFQDSIVKAGLIPEDNSKIVKETNFKIMGYGKRRVDAYVSDI